MMVLLVLYLKKSVWLWLYPICITYNKISIRDDVCWSCEVAGKQNTGGGAGWASQNVCLQFLMELLEDLFSLLMC